MKQITKYINERLILSKTKESREYGYIDELPLGANKSQEVFDVIYDRYDDMFSDVRLLRTGNIKLGHINNAYLVNNGLYNDSDFTLYIYEKEYVMRRSVPGSIGKFVKGFKSLYETLDKFDKLLTKRGYKIPK